MRLTKGDVILEAKYSVDAITVGFWQAQTPQTSWDGKQLPLRSLIADFPVMAG